MRILFLLSFLVLVGCMSVLNPSPLPTGYTYHGEVYKSPPGPEAGDIGYEYSYLQNENVQQVWLHAVRDLVVHLEERTGLAPQVIHVQDVLEQSAFNHTFDHSLRHVLRERGYILASAADKFPARLVYEAIPLDDVSVVRIPGVQSYRDTAPYNLILRLYKGLPDPYSVGKIYNIPAYGYSENGYVELKRDTKGQTRTRNFYILGGANH